MREVIWQAPSWLKPDPNRTVWATAFDGRGRVVSDLQKTLRSFYGATGVVESNDRLYLVSIERRAILSLDLCAVCDCAEAHAQDAAWRSAEQTPGSTFACPWRINDAVPAERGRPHDERPGGPLLTHEKPLRACGLHISFEVHSEEFR
jgi:hypothetical protein